MNKKISKKVVLSIILGLLSTFILSSITVLASFPSGASYYEFRLDPQEDGYESGQKEYVGDAEIQVWSSSDSDQKVYYRMCGSNNTNSFISESKWSKGASTFYLEYYSGEDYVDRWTFLRAYADYQNDDSAYVEGCFIP